MNVTGHIFPSTVRGHSGLSIIPSPRWRLLLATCAFAVLLAACSCSLWPWSTESPLPALYKATNGDDWSNNAGWLSDKPLGEWYGVSTDTQGRVIRLDLRNNNLSGSIPPEIGQLTQLTRLYLSGNQLSGSIPPEIGQLTQLTRLHLSDNQLSGSIPPEIGQLTQLKGLDLGGHPIKKGPTIGSLAELFGFSVPVIGDATLVLEVDDNNQFSGNIPPEMGRLTQLERLILGGSDLTGCIPDALRRVKVNDLDDLNLLDCGSDTSAISADRAALAAFYEATGGVGWSSNAGWLSDEPLGEWAGVTTDRRGRVVWLGLRNNGLTGSIPPEVGQLTQLKGLSLGGNQLTGSIPPEIGQLTQLTELHLWGNWLGGSIPPEVGRLTKLTGLWLQGNQLSGSIPPEIGQLTQLTELYLRNNNLSGSIPPEIGQLTQLTLLYLVGNQLSGSIPPEIGQLTQLTGLYLEDNQLSKAETEVGRLTLRTEFRGNRFSGSIPPEMGQLTQLRRLVLGGNDLTGCIPDALWLIVPYDLDELNLHYCGSDGDRAILESFYEATNGDEWGNSTGWLSDKPLGEWAGVTTDRRGRVVRLILSENQLTGSIPPEIGTLENLERLYLPRNRLTGSIPPEIGTLENLKGLRLHNNQLTGSIPPEIGTLEKLYLLNLSGNQLTGGIPPEIGTLVNLVWLNLSGNRLTGCIPDALRRVGRNDLDEMDLPDCGTGARDTSPTPAPTPTPTPTGDRAALTAFYHATNGDGWAFNRGWLSDKPLDQWHGVATDAQGRVVGLDLFGNRLSGSMPPEIGALENLEVLVLHNNRLTGSIPPEIGTLENLERLSLSRNRLTGCIPDALRRVGRNDLYRIDLPDCGAGASVADDRAALTATPAPTPGAEPTATPTSSDVSSPTTAIPSPTPTSSPTSTPTPAPTHTPIPSRTAEDWAALAAFYEATNGDEWRNNDGWLSDKPLDEWHGVETDARGRVVGLDLFGNRLSGSMPPEIGALENLEELDLRNNQLTGSIPPEIGALENLEELLLYDNQLTGTIPPEIGTLENLERLSLSRNRLTGCIPDALRRVGRNDLYRIDLPYCGAGASVADDRAALTAFYHATNGDGWAFNRGWLSDEPMGRWYGVTTDGDGRVADLDLSRNGLTGSIPPEIGALEKLEDLDLDNNGLTGSIPPEIGALEKLEELDLRNNQLTGSIPPEIGTLENLEWLRLDDNQLTGSIPPEIGALENLEELWLDDNQLTGSIPPEIGTLENLDWLDLSGNQLTGCIPDALRRVRRNGLDEIDLPDCGAGARDTSPTPAPTHTPIPSTTPTPTPTPTGGRAALTAFYHATNGDGWSINRGWLSDKPLDQWHGVTTDAQGRVVELDLSGDGLTGSIPPEIGQLTKLSRLSLSRNDLTGSIPPEIGLLTELNWLYLSLNDLTGSIPLEIGQLTQLKGLVLWQNQLSGSIPLEIGQLTELILLSLGGNQLSGCIPGQLQRVRTNDLDELGLPDCR